MVAYTGKYISILYRQEQKAINHTLRQYGLGYSCYNFLLYISTCEGCSQKQLCQHINMDEALATRTLTKLEQQGYLLRQKDSHSPRTLSLYLTDKGHDLIPIIRHALLDWWSSITESLTEEQTTVFMEQLKSMADTALIKGQQMTDINCTHTKGKIT